MAMNQIRVPMCCERTDLLGKRRSEPISRSRIPSSKARRLSLRIRKTAGQTMSPMETMTAKTMQRKVPNPTAMTRMRETSVFNRSNAGTHAVSRKERQAKGRQRGSGRGSRQTNAGREEKQSSDHQADKKKYLLKEGENHCNPLSFLSVCPVCVLYLSVSVCASFGHVCVSVWLKNGCVA